MSVEKSEVSIVRGCGASAASLRSAVALASGRLIYVVDGDIAGNEAKMGRFVARMEETGADIVVGTKRSRRWKNRLYFAMVRVFLGLPISDTQTGARLYRRETLMYALDRALSKSGAFDLELLTIAAGRGAKIAEVEMPEQAALARGAALPRGFLRAAVNDTLAIFYRARILGYYSRCLVPPPLRGAPDVSVVIACPGDSWMLRECLAALARQTYRAFEVIVLPDAALPRLAEEAGPGLPALSVLPTGKVRPAEKRNLGIRSAKGEVIAFIDDDAYPDAHWLELAVRYFGEPSIGGVGGPGVTPPGDCYLARLGGRVYDNVLVSGNYRYRYRAGGVRRDTEDYPSCNLFVRTDLLRRIGGYRTDFWPGEDTLLCKDIIDGFKRIIYDPWVVVYHHRRPLFGAHLRQLGRYGFHRGYFCKRFPSNSLRLSYFMPTLFVLYLVSWPFVCFLFPDVMPALPFSAWAAYLSLPVLLYAGLVLLTTATPNPVSWLLTAAGVAASHVTYGVQFLRGLLARKAPCEFIGADHGTARKGGKVAEDGR